MGQIKRTTQFCVVEPKRSSLRKPDWEMHPSWTAGMEGLNAYNKWVSEVVLPIAFQWIEEHKTEVYASVAEENRDDVGVVIASAFELVKALPSYANGLRVSREIELELEEGRFDPAGINPVWTGIAQKIREGTERVFEDESDVLRGTGR